MNPEEPLSSLTTKRSFSTSSHRAWIEIGYDCVAVGSGDEALNHMVATRFHVVLLDIRMPGRNGYEVLKAVRSGYPDTCVIMISALEDPDLATRVFTTLGAAGFIPKPWRIDKVADAIQGIVQVHSNTAFTSDGFAALT